MTPPDERDPELAALLEAAEREPPDLEALYAGVRGRIRAAEQSPLERVRAQPTWARRLLALGAFVVVVAAAVAARPRHDLDAYPSGLLALYVISVGALLSVCAFAALRPLQLPALSRGTSVALGLLAVASTVFLAVAPGFHDHASTPSDVGPLAHVACLVHGLLVGVPLYAVLRVLDRGSAVGRVLAASAAGLAGNLVLELSCAFGGATHLVAGHASIVALFVLGALALEWRLRPRA